MEFIQSLIDFIEAQGIVSFVVLALAVLMYFQQKNSNQQINGMLQNQKAESEQQGKMLDVLVAQSTSISEVSVTMSAVKAELLSKADEIAGTSNTSRRNVQSAIVEQTKTIEEQTESVTAMNEKFSELEQAVREAIAAMQEVAMRPVKLSEAEHNKLINDMSEKLRATMTECMQDVIKKATQETKAVQPEKDNVIEKPEEPKVKSDE